MNSNHTRWAIVWRLVLFAFLIITGCFAVVYEVWEVTGIAFVAAMILAGNIVYLVQKVHRNVNLFFESIKYEDGSLHFAEDLNDGHLKGIHQNLNRVNQIITDIRVKEAHNERFFQEFLKRSASGLIAVNKEYFVEIVNDAALAIIGLSNLTHLNRLQQQHSALYELLLQLEPGQNESIKLLQGNMLKQVAVKVTKIHFSEKEYLIFSLNDIRTELEENELETWQKLIRIMTHEIMNSIAPITSLSQTLNNYFIKDQQPIQLKDLHQADIDNTIKGLQVIEERANGLQSFVDNYRKLSKVPQPEFRSIALKHWLESIQLLFKGQADVNNISFEISNRTSKTSFIGDERLLTHVVLNLLHNATDALYLQENKSIQVIAENSSSGTLCLRVIDNGKGFHPEEQEQLFIPFYTTKENGSGIGLSLSRQIMRMHKGSISANSEPGSGAEFVLEI